MLHQRVEEWEAKLNALLRRVDETLEKSYGTLLARHPARLPHGSTPNPQQDGLFRVTASFTPGFGSKLGKGYVIHLDFVTLEDIPVQQREALQQLAIRLIEDGLHEFLPGRNLAVKRDVNVWKIVGDLSLEPKPDGNKS